MFVKKEELKNPIRVKTFQYCDYGSRNLKGSIYNDVMRMLKYISGDTNDGYLGLNVATEKSTEDYRKLMIFCEKENKADVSKAIKEYWG